VRQKQKDKLEKIFGTILSLVVIVVGLYVLGQYFKENTLQDLFNPAASSSVSSEAGSASTSQTAQSGEIEIELDRDGTTSAVISTVEVDTPPVVRGYDFSQPVPLAQAVDNSYFEDAAFVGDSRTDGFFLYSGIDRGKRLTYTGLSIFKLKDKKAITIKGQEYTLLEALALDDYGKVYLSLGVNELGVYDDEGFYDHYCEAIDIIRASQPDAVIYIQGLIPLNEDVIREKGGRDYLRNDRLVVYNDLMKQVARDKQVAFLDLYSAFVQEDGQLPAEASRDGVHLHREWCAKWLEYLQTHTVSYETLYPQTEENLA